MQPRRRIAGEPAAGAAETNPSAPRPESAAPAQPLPRSTARPKVIPLAGEGLALPVHPDDRADLFCVLWYFYERNEWYWWSVVGSTAILLVIYFNVQIDAWINDWYGAFFNMLQTALTQPGSVTPASSSAEVFILFAVLMPNILALVSSPSSPRTTCSAGEGR